MQTFDISELNFSESAIAHFHQMLIERGKGEGVKVGIKEAGCSGCLLYTSPSPRDVEESRMPSSA